MLEVANTNPNIKLYAKVITMPSPLELVAKWSWPPYIAPLFQEIGPRPLTIACFLHTFKGLWLRYEVVVSLLAKYDSVDEQAISSGIVPRHKKFKQGQRRNFTVTSK